MEKSGFRHFFPGGKFGQPAVARMDKEWIVQAKSTPRQGAVLQKKSRLTRRKARGAAAPPTFSGGIEKTLSQAETMKKNLWLSTPAIASTSMGPKVSKGRSESPLVAPAGAKPLRLQKRIAQLSKMLW